MVGCLGWWVWVHTFGLVQVIHLDAPAGGPCCHHLFATVKRHTVHGCDMARKALRARQEGGTCCQQRALDGASRQHGVTAGSGSGSPTSVLVSVPIVHKLTFLSSPPVTTTPEELRPILMQLTLPEWAANSSAHKPVEDGGVDECGLGEGQGCCLDSLVCGAR